MHFTRLMRILKRTLYKFVAIIVFIPCVSGMANNDTHDIFDINVRNNRKLEDMNEEFVLECSELQEVMAFIIKCYYTIIILTIILTMVLTANVTLTILFILSRSNCVRRCCRSLLCWCSGIFRIHLMDQSSSPSSRQQNLSE